MIHVVDRMGWVDNDISWVLVQAVLHISVILWDVSFKFSDIYSHRNMKILDKKVGAKGSRVL